MIIMLDPTVEILIDSWAKPSQASLLHVSRIVSLMCVLIRTEQAVCQKPIVVGFVASPLFATKVVHPVICLFGDAISEFQLCLIIE